MVKETTLKNRAIMKVISCIGTSTTVYHIAACKRMIALLYNYSVKNSTLTYITSIYLLKHKEIHNA
jgi:hypothetical protein